VTRLRTEQPVFSSCQEQWREETVDEINVKNQFAPYAEQSVKSNLIFTKVFMQHTVITYSCGST